jgi:glyceraldehyde 3-phosphate dehydrogenase
MTVRVGINGFGRIGKCVLRVLIERGGFVPAVINDLATPDQLAPLLKYDSVHGRAPFDVMATSDGIVAGGQHIPCLSVKEPEKIAWGDHGCDVVLECTGKFTERDGASRILAGGGKKVVISAPSKDPDITIVMGVNHHLYDRTKHHIVSNASCTTNCLAPVAKVLHERFGIEHGLMTTVHSYTNDQNILDRVHKDPRRARAAAQNMVPTTTGAAKAVALVLPELKGKLNGIAVRVPTPDVSLVDLVCRVGREVKKEEVNSALTDAAKGELRGVLDVTMEQLVSTDFIGSQFSSVVDGPSTDVMGGRLVKVLSWYDNEMGFSHRMADLAALVAG